MKKTKESKIEKAVQDDIAEFLGQSVTAPIQEALKGIAKEETMQGALDRLGKQCEQIPGKLTRISNTLENVSKALIEDENDDPIPYQIETAKKDLDDMLQKVNKNLNAANGIIDAIEQGLPELKTNLGDIVKGETAHIDPQFKAIHVTLKTANEKLASIDGRLSEIDALAENLNGVSRSAASANASLEEMKPKLDACGGRLDTIERAVSTDEGVAAQQEIIKQKLEALGAYREKDHKLLMISLALGAVNLAGILTVIILHFA